jgi:hypothetical protein
MLRPREAEIAATSRENQRSAAGSFERRKAPPGSGMRSRPVTVTRPGPGCREAGSRLSAGTKPRLTRTVVPSSRAKGVTTQ